MDVIEPAAHLRADLPSVGTPQSAADRKELASIAMVVGAATNELNQGPTLDIRAMIG